MSDLPFGAQIIGKKFDDILTGKEIPFSFEANPEIIERDKNKQYVKLYDGFKIITFWQEEIPKVASAGWVHKVESI